MELDVTGAGAIANLIKDGVDRIWPDATVREQNMLKVAELDNQLAQGQMAINQAEASNNSLFVAGGRPFIMWVCGLAFAYHMLLQPLLTYLMAIFGHTFPLPEFDSSMLSTTLMGMLGLGLYRTSEKMADKGQLPWQR